MTREGSLRRQIEKDNERRKILCYTLPPKEIYDVLHQAEAAGIELPDSVEVWWEKETSTPKRVVLADRSLELPQVKKLLPTF